MPRRNLRNKRVVITGASSGIGEQLARQLAQLDCRLLVNARRETRLTELAAQLQRESPGSEMVVVAGDITQPETRARIIESAQNHFAGLDILINNAGVGAIGPFMEASPDRLRTIMELNLLAPAEMIRLAFPLLKQGQQPLVVNMGSVLGHRAVPYKSEYCASKFALHGLSDAWRAEWVEHNIGVLLVSPSTTDSEFFDSVLEDSTGKNWKLSTARSPQYVARHTIKAMQRDRHEIILTASGKALVWLDRICPGLADRIVARFAN